MPNLLSHEHVDIWFCRPNHVNLEQLKSKYIALLTPQEHAKVFRYRFEADQTSSLLSRILIKEALSSYLPNIHMNDINMKEGPKGKLSLTNNMNNIEFNLSHTTGLIALAVSQHNPIGVDVEFLDRNNDTRNIAKHYFSESEVSSLQALPYDDQPSRFYDYWTLKESYIKAWGLGLSIPLKDFSFDISPPRQCDPQAINSNISLRFSNNRDDNPAHWQSFLFNVSPSHRAALSVHQKTLATNKPVSLRFYMCAPLLSCTEINLPFKHN